MKLYLGGPMRGIPEFNFPNFRRAAAELRAQGHEVFSPAERDDRVFGQDISRYNSTGDLELAEKTYGFDLREALLDNLTFICKEAEGIALLPGWRNSNGALAEYATALALDLSVIELTP